MNEILCDYCKERIAVHQFDNSRWCCETDVHRCPAYKAKFKKILDDRGRYYHSKKHTRLREIAAGEHKCIYCERIARFMISYYRPCCQPKGRLCPNYGHYISDIMKKRYIKNDEREKMSDRMIEVQNRPDVKTKKQEAMLRLHRGDCPECLDFQRKYESGRNKWRHQLQNNKETD